MAVAFTSQPSFSSGVTAATGYLNQTNDLLAYMTGYTNRPLLITAAPSVPIVGLPYLVNTGAALPLVSGTVLIYLTATVSVTISPPVDTTVGAFVKDTTSSWSLIGLQQGGYYAPTASVAIPNTFRGFCHLFANTAITVSAGGGIAAAGLTGTPLTAGTVYHLFQDSTTLRILA
jgi:hypothetical protein